MKFNFTRLMPGVALICLSLGSCKKNDAVSPSAQLTSELTNTTNVIALGEDELNAEVDALLSTDAATESVSSGSFDCKVVTYNPSKTVYPHITTADFGSGCSDGLGKTISGKRLTTVYADWRTAPAGTLISLTTFSNYSINGLKVSGSTKKTLTAAAPGPLGFKLVTTKTFKDQSGNTSTFVGTHYQTQIKGVGTPTTTDDVYNVTGTSTGIEVVKGSTIAVWRATIDKNNPVIKAVDCGFRSQGGLNIQIKQIATTDNEYLNYGDGTCDNKATLSVNNGTPVEVTLPLVFYTAHL